MAPTHEYWQLAWSQLWQLTLLAILVLVGARVLARRRPHLAHMLWLLVIAKALTPAVISSPTGVFCWLSSQTSLASDPLPDMATPPDQRRESTDDDLAAISLEPLPTMTFTVDRGEPRDIQVSPSPSEPSSRRAYGLILWVLWVAGGAVFLAAAMWRWRRYSSQLRSAATLERPDLNERVRELARSMGIRRRVRLAVKSSNLGPAVIGIWRPTIVLPAEITTGRTASELTPIIAHELAHVRRGDLWFALLQFAAQVVWWFHPLVRIACRRASRAAELCCDEAAIAASGCSPSVYARQLLEILEQKHRLAAAPVFPGVRPVDITSQRLERIMKLGQGSQARTPWWCWVVLAACAAIALPGAQFVAGADEPDLLKNGVVDKPVRISGLPLPNLAQNKPVYLATYDVEDLLIRLQAATEDVDEARSHLLDCLTWNAIGLWNKNRLIVRTDKDGHKRMEARLAALRQYGFRKFEIDTLLIKVPEDKLSELPLNWNVGKTGKASTQPAAAANERSSIGVGTRTLSDAERRRVLAKVRSFEKSVVEAPPKIVAMNGQPVEVRSQTQRPFVVAINEGQPQIRVVTEGVLLTYKVHRAGDRNQVDVTYDHADIDRVLVVAEDVPGAAEPVKLQRPIVDRRQCETAVRLADGQSLMIGGMTSSERLVSFAITRVRERPNKFSAAESELWEEAAKRRRDQTTAEIERRLKTTKLDMKASDAPLDAVLQAIGKQADINVVVDERGLAVEGLSAKTPVNFEVKEVSAAAALTALLKPLKLATEIRDEVLVVTSQNQNDIRVYANVYNVADLVIPVPKMVSLGGENEKAKGRAVADFDSLIDLTTSTITPDFWNEKGGPAAIQPFPTNLSLVVSHNQNGHQQIEELFGQLRQLQDVQIALELKLYKAAPGLAGVEAGRVRSLSQKRGGEFVELLEKEAELVSKVKVTLFNGQGLEAPLPFGRSRDDAEALVHLVPVVSDDRRSVTIQSTSNAQDTIDAMRRFQSRILKDGSYLVVNATSRDAIPMLGSLPYLGGLFRKTPPDQGQWVLICRPQIIVREEEEEKLGIELPRPLRR